MEPLSYEKGILYDTLEVKRTETSRPLRITVYTNLFQRAINWIFGGFLTGGTIQIQSGLKDHEFIRIKPENLKEILKGHEKKDIDRVFASAWPLSKVLEEVSTSKK